MMTKEQIKLEIDRVPEAYLDMLYQVIQVFEYSTLTHEPTPDEVDWHTFIAETYGCLADDPIERAPHTNMAGFAPNWNRPERRLGRMTC